MVDILYISNDNFLQKERYCFKKEVWYWKNIATKSKREYIFSTKCNNCVIHFSEKKTGTE